MALVLVNLEKFAAGVRVLTRSMACCRTWLRGIETSGNCERFKEASGAAGLVLE